MDYPMWMWLPVTLIMLAGLAALFMLVVTVLRGAYRARRRSH